MTAVSFGAPVMELPSSSVAMPNAVFHTNRVHIQRLFAQILKYDIEIALYGQMVFLVNGTQRANAGDWKLKHMLSIPAVNYWLASNNQGPIREYNLSFQGRAIRDNTIKRMRLITGQIECVVESTGIIEVPNVWGFQDIDAGSYLVLELEDKDPVNVRTLFHLDCNRTPTEIAVPNGNRHQLVAYVLATKPTRQDGRFIVGKAMEYKKKSYTPADQAEVMSNADKISYLPKIHILLCD